MIKEIHVKGVRKRYRYFELVVENLVFRKGINYVMGPNGSGKTTLLKIVSGLVRPDDGEIVYVYTDGRVVHDPTRTALNIVYVGEDIRYPNIEVVDILEAFAPEKDMLGFVVKAFGLRQYLRKKYWELSSGYRKRVQLAIARLIDPDVYLLDEPFANVDAGFVEELWGMLKSLANEGKAIILTSHLTIPSHSDKLVLIDQGRIVYDGPPEDLIMMMYEFVIEVSGRQQTVTWQELNDLIRPAKLVAVKMTDPLRPRGN